MTDDAERRARDAEIEYLETLFGLMHVTEAIALCDARIAHTLGVKEWTLSAITTRLGTQLTPEALASLLSIVAEPLNDYITRLEELRERLRRGEPLA
jgi:hypothetical protein